MSWQKYTPVAKGRPDAPVSISIPDEGGRGTPFMLVDQATMKSLGWKPDSHIMLSIGSADHDGKIRLEPAAGEPLRVRPPAGKVKRHRITLGRLPCLGGDRFNSACQFEVDRTAGGGRRFGRHTSRRRALAPAAARHGGGRRRGQR